MGHSRELEVALEAGMLAAKKILELYVDFEVIPNAPASITTEADRESQELILQTIRRHFPEDALCAEEKTPTLASALQTGPRTWVVDPIDGTRGFAQKNGEFSIMIALIEEGQPSLGVVLEPALGRLTYAVRGGGCWQHDEGKDRLACHVSRQDDMAKLTLTQSRSKPGTVSKQVTALAPARVIETHSAGVKLAQVARGEADVYVNHYPNFSDWDICAGHILVEEAGGRVTGLRGQEIRYGSPGAAQRLGLVASNGLLHDAVMERLRTVF